MNISCKMIKASSISIMRRCPVGEVAIAFIVVCGLFGCTIGEGPFGPSVRIDPPMAAGVCTAHKYVHIESGDTIYCKSKDSTPGLTEWTYEGEHSWFCDEVLTQCALE